MIPINRKAGDRLLWVGAMIAPILAVQVARMFEAEPVRSASADQVAISAPAARPMQKPTTAQQRALEWIAGQDLSRLSNPFVPAKPANSPVVAQPAPIEMVEPELEGRSPPPPMELTGVMDGQRGPLASINRKIFRLGDEVVPGWTLESVDARQKVVVVRSTQGNMLELTIKPPQSQP